MNRFGILAAVALPVVMAACAPKAPLPEPAPVLSAAEQACAAQAAAVGGVDVATVVVVPLTTTKSGATVHEVTAGEVRYSCVVELDNSISSFEAL
ncbi:MAG TPA: hypothetical protein PKA33_14580 [Amaricoccus sp.]|uniref:hypothetical protein n=1 Tax=Amaricoccus sp. TaxID=1872485 RepID=UPI002C96F4EF|nr:hypothetical protein [Amaricoccus sp.]HMQ94926.1 hypothetical protein [Amaricoccus sp.]HMR53535.1 hypothetical protein [Amaricoccus sp.]HMR61247.1 hypothetical protein [Amaricoccus sp.]HMU00576.1 hypothetical protein [Amaricoccus sp.]